MLTTENITVTLMQLMQNTKNMDVRHTWAPTVTLLIRFEHFGEHVKNVSFMHMCALDIEEEPL